MGRSKEGKLQVKQFGGVNRFIEGTLAPPNVHDTLQNFDSPNPGELKSVRGITDLTGVALPGVAEIRHEKFLELNSSERVLVALYQSSVTNIPIPDVSTVTPNGAANTTRKVSYVFVGPGGSYGRTAFASSANNFNSTGGAVATLPTNVPDYISCIHVYAEAATGGTALWAGSFTRRANVFPATITIPTPGTPPGANAPVVIEAIPLSLSSTYSSGVTGNLSGGRVYHFGFAPWVPGGSVFGNFRALECSFVGDASNTAFLSAFLPDGYSALTVTFDYLPYGYFSDLSPVSPSPDLDTVYDYGVVLCGPTIEDGLPVASSKTDGTVIPVATTAQVLSFATSNGADTFDVTGEIPNGAFLKVTDWTGTVPVPNQYYYVVNAEYNGSTTTLKLSLTQGGTPIVVVHGTPGVQTGNFRWRTCTAVVKELPYNSDLWAEVDIVDSFNVRQGHSDDNLRKFGLLYLQDTISGSTATRDPQGLGGMVFTDLPHTPANRREILTSRFQNSLSIIDRNPEQITTSEFEILVANSIQSRQYASRLWMVNGYNGPFYTNGYVLKPATVNDGRIYYPIVEFIEFFNDQMILAGSRSNQTYTSGYFFYGVANSPYDFGVGPLGRVFPAIYGDETEIRGLNIYSQDLSNVGPKSFLVIGKQASVVTWNGSTGTDALIQQIDKASGLAGANAYALTKVGPIFVGADNVYLLQNSSSLIPVGDEVKSIIDSLTDDQRKIISLIYHENFVKIGYPSDPSSGKLDLELRCYFNIEQGQLTKRWSGPHALKEYEGQAIITRFSGQQNYRVSHNGAKLYRRDDPGSFLNDGQKMHRSWKFDRQGLGQDDLLKLITRLKVAFKTVTEEDVTFTLESEDGSPSIAFTSTIPDLGNIKRMLDICVPERFLARVVSIGFDNYSDADMSIYDITTCFETMKRQKLS